MPVILAEISLNNLIQIFMGFNLMYQNGSELNPFGWEKDPNINDLRLDCGSNHSLDS